MINPGFTIQRRGKLDILSHALGPNRDACIYLPTRRGGCSFGRGDLNLSFGTGDEEKNVAENRRLLGEALGVSFDNISRLRQVHSADVVVLSEGERRTANLTIPAGDAMITNAPGHWLGVSVGDCQAVAIYAAERQALALVHAGWAGTAKRIVAAAIGKLKAEFDCKPEEMWAALMPAVGRSVYQVDGPVFSEFEKHWRDWEGYFVDHRNGKAYLDLATANRAQLEAEGVPPEQVAEISLCTATLSSLFFSHRRDGLPGGRMYALAVIRSFN